MGFFFFFFFVWLCGLLGDTLLGSQQIGPDHVIAQQLKPIKLVTVEGEPDVQLSGSQRIGPRVRLTPHRSPLAGGSRIKKSKKIFKIEIK
jgi:hypothetical protein